MTVPKYYLLSKEQVLHVLNVTHEHGRSADDVDRLHQTYGYNELTPPKKKSPFIIFVNQFRSFLIYLLIIAVIISVYVGEYLDAGVVLFILILNAFLGFIQEYNAERAIDALKKLTSHKTRVIRSGKTELVDSRNLVPGDIVLFEEGSKISADCRIIHASSLFVSEASLTGESVPVEKHDERLSKESGLADQRNMLFSGTVVTRGKCIAAVTAIGMNAEIGKIATMISEDHSLTPLQKQLNNLGKWIGGVTLALCTMLFVIGIIKEGYGAAEAWLMTAVALAVAAVPEGLPAVVTISLSISVVRMAKRNALIRRIHSVETLGQTTVICSDKTGTLTQNAMTVRGIYVDGKSHVVTGVGYSVRGEIEGNISEKGRLLFIAGALCNDATLNVTEGTITGDPTEAALLVSAEKNGIDHRKLQHQWVRIKEDPFDSVKKVMSTVNRDQSTDKTYVFMKGAPERVLACCNRIQMHGKVMPLRATHRKMVLQHNDYYARNALRVLGFAYKPYKKGEKTEDDLIFIGLQGMIDPPHTEVHESVRRCHEAGIRVIMITGDNRLTAEGIAHEIGIMGASINGADFAALHPEEQVKTLSDISIFARVEPQHKVKIVELLQLNGEVVAMTGDGVNDAPALKKADLGVAMGITGTDVAKEASEMVLQDDNFTSIVNAIEEGRGIYQNIRKFVLYLLSCNIGEVFFIFGAIILNLPLPLNVIMILWLNLVTDGLPAIALSVDPNPPHIMNRPPKKAKEGILTRLGMMHILFLSILYALGSLGVYYWAYITYGHIPDRIAHIQTMGFTAITLIELFSLFAIRKSYHLPLFSNKYLLMAIVGSILLQFAVIYSPLQKFFGTVALSLLDWAIIVGVCIGIYLVAILTSGLFSREKSTVQN